MMAYDSDPIPKLLDAALRLRGLGVSIFPVTADKRPAFDLLPNKSWQDYQGRIATEQEIKRWFSGDHHGVTGLAVVCGTISGNLVCLDFDRDTHDDYETWRVSVGSLADGAPTERSGKGWHVFMRLSDGLVKNEKLARAWAKDASGKEAQKTIVETKGEGGYVVVAPSLHGDTGKLYTHVSGDWASLPLVSREDFDFARAVAISLDESDRGTEVPGPGPGGKTSAAAVPTQHTNGAIRQDEIDEVMRSINGFLKRCEASAWDGDFISWGKVAVVAKSLDAIVGRGIIWDAFREGSERHPAYDARRDDRILRKMENMLKTFVPSWATRPFAYNYNDRKKRVAVELKGWIFDEKTRLWWPNAEERRKAIRVVDNDYSETPGSYVVATAEYEEEAPRPPKLPRYIDLLDMDQIPPLEFLSDYLPIPRGGYAVVFGPPGGRKTFWAIDRALRLACDGKRAVYITGEGLSGIKQRAKAFMQTFGIVPERGHMIFKTAADNFLESLAVETMIDELAEYGQIDFIVVDTLARSMIGGDENSAADMGRYNAACLRIQEATGAAIMPIHHTGKAGGSERGSSALRGAADTMFDISSDDTGLVTVECAKQKDAPPFKKYHMQAETIDLGNGESSCVLMPSDNLKTAIDTELTEEHVAILQCLAQPIYAEAGAMAADIRAHINFKAHPRTFTRRMSYLKINGYVEQISKVKTDPYRITDRGREMLAALVGETY